MRNQLALYPGPKSPSGKFNYIITSCWSIRASLPTKNGQYMKSQNLMLLH